MLGLALLLGGAAGCGDAETGALAGEPEVAADALGDADAVQDPETSDAGPELAPPDVSYEPPSLFLTVERIPDVMNGSTPFSSDAADETGFTLRVNRERISFDLRVEGDIDPDTLDVRCDVPMPLPDGTTLSEGAPIPQGGFVQAQDDPSWWSFEVRPDNPLPDAALVTCTATVEGPAGQAESAVTVETATLPAQLDPFVTIDDWLVVLERDIFSLDVQVEEETISLSSVYEPEGNGAADFDEPFFVIGLFSDKTPERNAQTKARLLGTIRQHAYRIFGLDEAGQPTPEGVPLRLWFEGDPGAPSVEDFAAGGLSMIALGGDGDPEDQAGGTVGRAKVDWNNQGHEDDTEYGLGVWPTAIIRQALEMPIAIYILEEVLPGRGVPIGEHPLDEALFAPDFDPDLITDPELSYRAEVYTFAVDMLGLALASTLCHEMGHSLGLVPSGPPPEGLFAGIKGLGFADNFVPGAHVDTPGLNVMQTGAVTNWVEALEQVPRFNALNSAYLRRRLVIGTP